MVKRYLSLISLERAIDLTLTSFEKPDKKISIPVINSVGRFQPLRYMRNIPFLK